MARLPASERSSQRNFTFKEDIHAILDAIPEKSRSAWVASAIEEKARRERVKED